MSKNTGLLVLSLALAVGLVGCGPPKPDQPDGGGGTTPYWTDCGDLNLEQASNPIEVWPEGDTYGVNTFYLWQLDRRSSACDADYCYHDDGEPVDNRLPYKDWQIPNTLWSAIRMNWDGYDPYHFTADDPFYLGYLPDVPSIVSWESKTGARNDGTCPESDHLYYGRHTCIGADQLDELAPSLVHGRAYLFQLSMVVPLGVDAASGYKFNRVQSCYRQIIEY